MRYLLVDRIEEMKKLSYAIGIKCISLSDDAFEHHFPGHPIYPGALLLESMAQLGGAFLEVSLRRPPEYCPRCVLSTVKAKFRQFVQPGDRLIIRADVVSRHEESAFLRIVTTSEGEKVCEADILYVLLEIPDPTLEASRQEYLGLLTRNTRFIQ